MDPLEEVQRRVMNMIRRLEDFFHEDRLREWELFCLERRRLQEMTYSSLSVPEGGLQESWRETFCQGM